MPSYVEQLIFNEEMAYLDAPGNGGVGVSSVGPAIMMHGNEAQKRLYLPRIAGAEDTWCALYSEPSAGSDLASIQTRAVRDGDEYVVTGTKLWVAGAQDANMGYLAARTDPNAPKHRGISTFILPMDSAGVSMRPIASMAGDAYLTEVHLDRVRIPAGNLVGVENRGWYQLARTLDFERSSVAAYAGGKRNVERLVNLVKEDADLVRQHPSRAVCAGGPLDRDGGGVQHRVSHSLAADAGGVAELRGVGVEAVRLGADAAHRGDGHAVARLCGAAGAGLAAGAVRGRDGAVVPRLGGEHDRGGDVRGAAEHYRAAGAGVASVGALTPGPSPALRARGT